MSADRSRTPAGLDPGRVVAELRRRFPGVCAWWGVHTGRWWAMTRDRSGRDVLVEAGTPAELGRRLEAVRGRGTPQVSRELPPMRARRGEPGTPPREPPSVRGSVVPRMFV